MTYEIFDQNGDTTMFSSQTSKMTGAFETVADAINHLKGIIAERKWTILDMDIEEDFADVAAASGTRIHTFTIEAV